LRVARCPGEKKKTITAEGRSVMFAKKKRKKRARLKPQQGQLKTGKFQEAQCRSVDKRKAASFLLRKREGK